MGEPRVNIQTGANLLHFTFILGPSLATQGQSVGGGRVPRKDIHTPHRPAVYIDVKNSRNLLSPTMSMANCGREFQLTIVRWRKLIL